MTAPEDRFKRTNYLVKQLGFGHAAFVHLFITKHDASSIIQCFESNIFDEREAFLRLRHALRTVKMVVPMNGGDNFEDEFVALYHSNRLHHPNLAEMLPGQNGHFRKEWFEIEGFPAGTLSQYAEAVSRPDKFDSTPPVAFGWHMVCQLCEALLAFQFSASVDLGMTGSWPMFFHGDATAANMLFREPSMEISATSFPGYPDIVLCDLGEAKELRESPGQDDFFHAQYQDARMVLTAIKTLFSIHPITPHLLFSQQIQSCIEELARTELDSRYKTNSVDLKKLLVDLSSYAKSSRWTTYTSLDTNEAFEPKAVAYFSREHISDARLRRFWVKLRDGQIDDSYDPEDGDSSELGGDD